MSASKGASEAPRRLFLITTEDPESDRDSRAVERALTKIGKPCHVMARTWVIETDEPLDNLFKILSTSVFAGNEGGFLVAPLAGDWSCRNAKTKDDCYRRV